MTMKKSRKWLWILWALITVVLAAWLSAGLLDKNAASDPTLSQARAMLLPGKTTHGHHQIEMACESCHTQAFGGKDLIQEACVNCHGAELKEANDTHPSSKFDDPRNADRLEKLDAQYCITCHIEHRPAVTKAMGLTLPRDVCFNCHSGPDEMPPDHKQLKFDTCTNSGCHNYHDNRSLYEDFLLKHRAEPKLLDTKLLPQRDFHEAVREMMSYPAKNYPLQPLTAAQQDAPPDKRGNAGVQAQWLATAHAKSGVNCSACHVPSGGERAGAWIDRPGEDSCKTCHAPEVKGFLAGKHGMRIAQGLAPMTPVQARLPMHDDAHGSLGCTSCHGAHGFDTKKAAVEACTGCHADQHTQAYKQSPHFQAWQDELAGKAPPGSGVSCASCHMPRVKMPTDEGARIVVQHNQNDTLRPSAKMTRPVCMNCHGLGFSTDALADPALVRNNFRGAPAVHVESIDMAVRKEEEKKRK